MAPHHHLRASFIANPVLFSFPAAATAVVAPLCRAAAGPSTATTLVKDDVVVRPVESGFWRAFKAGTVGARNRERGLQLGQGQGQEVEKQGDKGMVTRKRKRALVFAGLGSYPHQPSSPTDASLRLWERASEALVTPCEAIGYVPRTIDVEKGAMKGSMGDGMDPALWRRWNKAWLRGWVGNRSINELMDRPDIKAAYVLTSNLAILASAQAHAEPTSSFLPQDVTHLLGYGFIGTLTALVATDKVKLEDAVRLACIYASLPPHEVSPGEEPGKGATRHWMTTLLALSHDTSRTRKYSLSDAIHHHPSSPSSAASSSYPLAHVLEVIRDMQEHEGWNENLLPMCAQREDEEYGVVAEAGDWSTREWAGEAMINSPRSLVISGTKGAVIKIIDRLRGGGLATPVMDLHMPCPYHTPIMRGAVFQFRQALKGCPFHPSGGANGLTGKSEPNVTILDGMTAKPLPMNDIPGALTAYLTRPLQWAQTTRSLWAPSLEDTTLAPVVDEISIVGRGARGLGIAIDREIGEARRQREQEARVQEQGAGLTTGAGTVGRTGHKKGRATSRRRLGGSVFPMTADVPLDEQGAVRVVEYNFEERR